MSDRIYTAPTESQGHEVRGKTLPDLLYEAAEKYPNPRAFNQPNGDGTWQPISTHEFRTQAEETALGLLELGLERGDKVALFMENDAYFCIADMGCLIAGLVDVPVYLTSRPNQIQYVLDHAEARALIVSTPAHLEKVAPLLSELPRVETVVVAEMEAGAVLAEGPEGVEVLSLGDLRARGRTRQGQDGADIPSLLSKIKTDDLATLIYTSGTTGQPKGVMLTHENVSSNSQTSLTCFTGFEAGAGAEVALSFLPLTHIYARSIDLYGFMSQGTSIYFCEPDDLAEAMKKVRPTVFNSVPRLLEKVYGSIQDKTASAEGLQKKIGTWALELAKQYRIGETPSLAYKAQAAVADALVFKKWRAALGGRIKYIVIGGAALSAELAHTFAAAGIPLIQGYGLTETSPVITFNRPDRNRAGTVGEPIPGVEVRIAEDGEILTRGPHVMRGYYKAQDKTDEVLTEDGWFHTGDIGEFTEEGRLRITDRKKALFKLSTGKYVTPTPLEGRLATSALVEQAVVVGEGHKFCAALLFPSEASLRTFARRQGLDAEQPLEDLVKEEKVIDEYQRLVDEANEDMDPWSTIKRFTLVPGEMTVGSGLLTPTMKVKRAQVHEQYSEAVEEMYAMDDQERRKGENVHVS